MRIKSLVRRAKKWMHEFPELYAIEISADFYQPEKENRFWIRIKHDKSMSKETKELIGAKLEAESHNHGYPIAWIVDGGIA